MKLSKEGAAFTGMVLEVFRLNGLLLEAGDRLTAPLGLTSARWQVLGAIDVQGSPLTVAQISRRMGLSRQNVQRIANDLERLGFVSFGDNPDHKRAKLVSMTPHCQEVLAKLETIQARWANDMACGIDPAALTETLNTLNILLTRCTAAEQAATRNSKQKEN